MDEGYPYTIPVNFVYENRHIYFHSALQGHKIDALRLCPKASFTVIDEPVREENDWWYYVRSVICFGIVNFIDDEGEKAARLLQLGKKYFPDGYDIDGDLRQNGSRTIVLDLEIEHMTGKQVKEQ